MTQRRPAWSSAGARAFVERMRAVNTVCRRVLDEHEHIPILLDGCEHTSLRAFHDEPGVFGVWRTSAAHRQPPGGWHLYVATTPEAVILTVHRHHGRCEPNAVMAGERLLLDAGSPAPELRMVPAPRPCGERLAGRLREEIAHCVAMIDSCGASTTMVHDGSRPLVVPAGVSWSPRKAEAAHRPDEPAAVRTRPNTPTAAPPTGPRPAATLW